MIKGQFTGEIPIVKVVIGWKDRLQEPFAVLDTGFTGDLQITPLIASELGLEIQGVINMKAANGHIFPIETAFATASMEGDQKNIRVLISDSTPLVGIGLLSKFDYKAIVDCKYRTVTLEKA